MNERLYPIIEDPLRIKPLGEGYVIRNQRTLKINAVNDSLGLILKECNGKTSIVDISAKLSKRYSASTYAEIHADVIDAAKELESKGYLKLTDTPRNSKLVVSQEKMPFPLDIVYLELTDKCNMRCLHCYRNAKFRKNKSKAKINWLEVIDTLDKLGVFAVVLTGGEPLLCMEFVDIVKYLRSKEVNFQIITNGLLLDLNMIRLLTSLNPELVSISLDGATSFTHDFLRGTQSFHKVVNNARLSVSEGLNVKLNTSLYKKNESEIEQMVELASSIGVRSFIIETFMELGRGNSIKELALPLRTAATVKETIKKKLEELKSKGKHVPLFVTNDSKGVRNNGEENSCYPTCGVGTFSCLIKHNGDVALCPPLSDKRFVAGNLLSNKLKDIWLNSPVFDQLRNHNLDDIESCRKCEAKSVCGGGCKARAFAVAKNFVSPDKWSCSFWGSRTPIKGSSITRVGGQHGQ